jgi:uncharacterized protein YraI
MKILLLIFFITFTTASFAQIPKSGTYTYNYCDEEYNTCLSKCKVKIKGNKIWVYAPAGLTGIKKGELYESGIIYKHASGKWVIIHNKKEKPAATNGVTGQLVWIDFKRKNCWTF